MSKLLQQAIDKIRELPEDEQDMAATEIFAIIADFATTDERAAIVAGRKAYDNGEVVSLEKWQHDMEVGTH